MNYQDKKMSCKECGETFAFTAAEQAFYAEKGFQNEPSRCPQCRTARKQRMGGGSNDRQQREAFEITCSACGASAQVPFKPTAGKPVFCRDCFQANKRFKS